MVRFFKKECAFRIQLKGSKCYCYIKDGCSSILGGESFNTIYATILKKVNFGGTPLQ
jgi:hypothetical protein